MESGSALRRRRDGEILIRDAGSAGRADGGVSDEAKAKTSDQERCDTAAFPHITVFYQ